MAVAENTQDESEYQAKSHSTMQPRFKGGACGQQRRDAYVDGLIGPWAGHDKCHRRQATHELSPGGGEVARA